MECRHRTIRRLPYHSLFYQDPDQSKVQRCCIVTLKTRLFSLISLVIACLQDQFRRFNTFLDLLLHKDLKLVSGHLFILIVPSSFCTKASLSHSTTRHFDFFNAFAGFSSKPKPCPRMM